MKTTLEPPCCYCAVSIATENQQISRARNDAPAPPFLEPKFKYKKRSRNSVDWRRQ